MNEIDKEIWMHNANSLVKATVRFEDYRFYLSLALLTGWVALVSTDKYKGITILIPFLVLLSIIILMVQVYMVREAISANIGGRRLSKLLSEKMWKWLECISLSMLLLAVLLILLNVLNQHG